MRSEPGFFGVLGGLLGAREPAEDDDECLLLGGHEAEEKDVTRTTQITLERRFAQLVVRVQLDFLQPSAHQMVHDVAALGVVHTHRHQDILILSTPELLAYYSHSRDNRHSGLASITIRSSIFHKLYSNFAKVASKEKYGYEAGI